MAAPNRCSRDCSYLRAGVGDVFGAAWQSRVDAIAIVRTAGEVRRAGRRADGGRSVEPMQQRRVRVLREGLDVWGVSAALPWVGSTRAVVAVELIVAPPLVVGPAGVGQPR